MSSTLPSNVPHFETAKPPRKDGPAIGGIVITVILALALVAIIVVAVTRLSSGQSVAPQRCLLPRPRIPRQRRLPLQQVRRPMRRRPRLFSRSLPRSTTRRHRQSRPTIQTSWRRPPRRISTRSRSLPTRSSRCWRDRHQAREHRVGADHRQRRYGHSHELRDVDHHLQRRHHRAVARSERVYAGARQRHLESAVRRAPRPDADNQ